MATKKKVPEEIARRAPPAWGQVAFPLVAAVAKLVQQFGIATTMLAVCLGAIKVFGDAKTQNDFIREMLFGEVTHAPYVRGFFIILLFNALLGLSNRAGRKAVESQEMKRIAGEKSRLQAEALADKQLSHTDPPEAP